MATINKEAHNYNNALIKRIKKELVYMKALNMQKEKQFKDTTSFGIYGFPPTLKSIKCNNLTDCLQLLLFRMKYLKDDKNYSITKKMKSKKNI